MKKLRALLRLVRPVIGDATYREENARYRDAAKKLASAREAFAVLATFDDLVGRYADHVAPEAFSDLRRRLREHKQAGELGDDREIATALLHDARERPLTWTLDEPDFALLAGGFRQSYARARRAFRRAYERGESEAFHEWRKRSKAHWYHVRLLVPSWPGPLGALETELHRLSELLGDEHDLADLEAAISTLEDAELEHVTGVLRALLVRRREELRRDARTLGERVFAERPAQIVRRFRACFSAWQREAEPKPASSVDTSDVDEADDAIDDARVSQNAHVT
jgi:CHAD domain-containing protein